MSDTAVASASSTPTADATPAADATPTADATPAADATDGAAENTDGTTTAASTSEQAPQTSTSSTSTDKIFSIDPSTDLKKDAPEPETNPGKSLVDHLIKNKVPVAAVVRKDKELLLDILGSEKYQSFKKTLESDRYLELKEKFESKPNEQSEGQSTEQCGAAKANEDGASSMEVEQQEHEDKKEEAQTNTSEIEEEKKKKAEEEEQKQVEEEEKKKMQEEYKEIKEGLEREQIALNQAMIVAVTTKQPEFLELLLKAGANINAFDKWYPVVHTIVDMGSMELFNIVKDYVKDIKVVSHYGNLLHTAARAGSMEILQLVYDLGVTDFCQAPANGSTPLHDAVRNVQVIPEENETENADEKDSTKDENSKPDSADKETKECQGTKSTGILFGKPPKYDMRIINFLLSKGCPVDGVDNRKKTPLHEAAIFGNKDVAKILTDAGANKRAKDDSDKTPWLYSVVYDQRFLWEDLVDLENLNEPVQDNMYYVHLVCEIGNHRALRFIIDNGADVSKLSDGEHGKTALLIAVQKGHMECIRVILNQPDPGLKNEKGNSGGADNNPFFAALRNFSNYRDKHEDILELFLKKGADIDGLYQNGHTPLVQHLTSIDVVEWLLKHGANANYVDENGSYPLFHACMSSFYRDVDVVKLLLKHNADVTMTHLASESNNEPLTALQVAIERRSYDLMKLCLAAGFSLFRVHDWLQLEIDRVNNIIADVPDFKYLHEYIKTRPYAPLSLKGLARLSVLKIMHPRNSIEDIKQLGLPVILEEYLDWDKFLTERINRIDDFVENLKKQKE